ncbi:tRNA pseudouridine(38-40) synthase TruA [Methylotenera mobilis]|uniref:tRNA pseudouridine synthase A n=1 Tax=Methylotenera mobilis (strain JLW8 / ATCC BAA-1282 / DSM 17540) TaxID=583345 RepID=C6WVD8_METML|nr:tRNA pseudouridine(38-40) synthase TruA [Methylotenera mobilis]ACT47887.1 tRNA pseudouridine synthase A [Methylotenera mobilis JLW8]
MKIALGVSYDGSLYCGWQSQPSACGVQDALESALQDVAQHAVRVHAAGRTDTGVHALGQIVHFETDAKRPLSAWVRGVNAHLPATIRVEWAHAVDDDFHARFSAFSRSYQYLLYNAPVASALMADKAGWFHLPLDYAAMSEAASYLIGEHDFTAFRASECQAKTAIRHMSQAGVVQSGQFFLFNFSANAFLQHQVRNMVGALIYIGKGKYPPAYMRELLQGKDRTLSPPTFSPNGLYLTDVGYDAKWGLPKNMQPGLKLLV